VRLDHLNFQARRFPRQPPATSWELIAEGRELEASDLTTSAVVGPLLLYAIIRELVLSKELSVISRQPSACQKLKAESRKLIA
jgi:hypothetical protein